MTLTTVKSRISRSWWLRQYLPRSHMTMQSTKSLMFHSPYANDAMLALANVTVTFTTCRNRSFDLPTHCCSILCMCLWTVVRMYQPDTNLSVWQSLTQSILLWRHQWEYSNVQDNQEHITTAASFITPHSARELLWHHVRIHWCPGSNNYFFLTAV